MNEASEFRDLLPALPEIVLAVGAMVLLMLGAFRGERSAGAMNRLAILLLIGAGAIALLIAWATVFVHASRVANANPIHALRYE